MHGFISSGRKTHLKPTWNNSNGFSPTIIRTKKSREANKRPTATASSSATPVLMHLRAVSILLTHWFQNVSCYKLEHCLGSCFKQARGLSLQPDLGHPLLTLRLNTRQPQLHPSKAVGTRNASFLTDVRLKSGGVRALYFLLWVGF